jgi:G3E family GTPase
MSENETRIPVWILTGFLGSGKTTLLNHLVKQPQIASTALIINEFGDIGIDHLLVETSTETMIEMNNGCICCTIRGDLADKLGALAMWIDAGRVAPVGRVIVETTGLADPAPILHTLVTDEHLLARFRLTGVLTVVDAIAGLQSLENFSEAEKQAALADMIVMSKRDLVGTSAEKETYQRLDGRVRAINPRARIFEVPRGMMDPQVLIEVEGRRADVTFEDFSRWVATADDHSEHEGNCGHACESGPRHERSDTGITSFVIRLDEAVEVTAFDNFLQQLASEFGEKLLRVKGIVLVRDRPDQPAVVQGVQHVFFPVTWLDHWPDEERTSKLVFITHGLERAAIEDRFGAYCN